jgi:Beta-ketoacyl synthase, N-terminal domain
MAGRFPGAPALDAFWDNLRRGVESINHFPSDELEDAYGHSVQNQPGYVRARSILDGVALFDGDRLGGAGKRRLRPGRLFLEKSRSTLGAASIPTSFITCWRTGRGLKI